MDEAGEAPDVARAIEQHQGYVTQLRDAGIAVEVVPAADDQPDACFVEDGAVLLDHRVAVITRPGAPSRRAETADIERSLSGMMEIWRITAPATVDGGDVMRMGSRLFVGRSSRTNDAAVEQLRALGHRRGLTVRAVEVTAGLHLKSACTVLDASTVLLDAEALSPSAFEAEGITAIAVPEPLGANVLALSDRILVSDAAPETAAWLRSRGDRVVQISLTEFHRGDGALSCLSLRRPPMGGWSV